MKHKASKKPTSLNRSLNNLLITVLLPLSILIITIIAIFTVYNVRYAEASGNIAMASQFNQNFKDDIDLKMYYFATDSEYATGIPYDEVDRALSLAQNLKDNTQNRESLKAVNSVLSLSGTLKDRIVQIEQTAGYDERIEQLESNVYILTELIQNYMYTYLFYEAGELANLQASMNRSLTVAIVLAIVATIVVVLITANKTLAISRSITQPIDGLYSRVQEIGEGRMESKEPVYADDKKLQALSLGFEEMVDRIEQLMELNTLEAERIRSMEFMLLQAQINPHFLYNTLDTIIWLVETGKNSQAVDMVSSLSTFFRTSLSKGRDVITLAEEELHVRSYLEIQQVRYKDILEYNISIDPAIGEYTIPKLTLQPIVENALYHGIKMKRGKGNITITGEFEDGKIALRVFDTGTGMDEETLKRTREDMEAEHARGFGMAAVYRRLLLMFKDECSFEINSEQGIGTTISIKIPAVKEQTESEKA